VGGKVGCSHQPAMQGMHLFEIGLCMEVEQRTNQKPLQAAVKCYLRRPNRAGDHEAFYREGWVLKTQRIVPRGVLDTTSALKDDDGVS